MPYDDDKFGSLFPTRTGTPMGQAEERKMLDAIGGSGGFRTRIQDNPDGSKTLMRTRNGRPHFETSRVADLVSGTGIQLFHGLIPPSDLLTRTDWPSPVPATVTSTVVKQGYTYYSDFPLVLASALAEIPAVGAYTISPNLATSYDINATDTNKPHYGTRNAGMQWPYRTASGDVRWFRADVTPAPSISMINVTVTRDDGLVICSQDIASSLLWGAEPVDFGVFNRPLEHSPSGKIVLLCAYLNGSYGGTSLDPRSDWTLMLLVGVLRVTLTNETAATVSVEKRYVDCIIESSNDTVTSQTYDPTKPTPYYFTRTKAWTSEFTSYGNVGWAGDYYGVLDGYTLSAYDVNESYSIVINSPNTVTINEVRNKYLLTMFFDGKETPAELTVETTFDGETGMVYSASGTFTKFRHFKDQRFFQYVGTPPSNILEDSAGSSGSMTQTLRDYSHTISTFKITCGETSRTFTYSTFDREQLGTSTAVVVPGDGADAPPPLTSGDLTYTDPNNFTYFHSDSVASTQAGWPTSTTSTTVVTGAGTVIDTKLYWVFWLTNNVFRTQLGPAAAEYDASYKRDMIVSSSQFVEGVPGETYRYKASWNPRHGTLAINDNFIQWV